MNIFTRSKTGTGKGAHSHVGPVGVANQDTLPSLCETQMSLGAEGQVSFDISAATLRALNELEGGPALVRFFGLDGRTPERHSLSAAERRAIGFEVEGQVINPIPDCPSRFYGILRELRTLRLKREK